MRHLGVLAKYWQPGKVLTRLAARIGNDKASELQRAFVRTLLLRLAPYGDRRVLVFTPEDRRAEFEGLATESQTSDAWQFESQVAGDLGNRMQHFISGTLRHGSDRVVLLGSDSPNVPLEYVALAFDYLEETPLVLGRTADGGYYLVGARDQVPPIFQGIPWSSDSVWSETTSKLARLGRPYEELPPWYDVDHWEDLVRLASELPTDAPHDKSLSMLKTSIRDVMDGMIEP